MQVGDTVIYKGREWYLYSLSNEGLCTIVAIRDGKITNVKNGEERLNASIVNLNISEICLQKF
jgi:hypothetical protein